MEPNSEQIARLRAERDLEHEGRLHLVTEIERLKSAEAALCGAVLLQKAHLEKARAERDAFHNLLDEKLSEIAGSQAFVRAYQEQGAELAQAREAISNAKDHLPYCPPGLATDCSVCRVRDILDAALSSPSSEKPCPLCDGAGYRQVMLPPYKDESKTEQVQCCDCHGTGTVSPSSEPASQEPSKESVMLNQPKLTPDKYVSVYMVQHLIDAPTQWQPWRYEVAKKQLSDVIDQLASLRVENDRLARVNDGQREQIAGYQAQLAAAKQALEDCYDWVVCSCGHPACGRCRATKAVRAALQPGSDGGKG